MLGWYCFVGTDAAHPDHQLNHFAVFQLTFLKLNYVFFVMLLSHDMAVPTTKKDMASKPETFLGNTGVDQADLNTISG